jgi:hypothetical protein
MTEGNGGIKHWAKVPRQVVLHRMETSDCLDSRLFWAIILWSWCGPETTDGCVVRKDHQGFIVSDPRTGKPIPATLKDLRELLGLAPGMKGPVSRSAARLEEVGSIRWGERIPGTQRAQMLYAVQEPPASEGQFEVAGPGNLNQDKKVWNIGHFSCGPSNLNQDKKVWNIGHFSCGPSNLPSDPELRARAISWLDQTSSAWRTERNALRARYREMCAQAISDGLILIDKKQRSRRVETSSSEAVPEEPSNAEPTTTTPPDPPPQQPAAKPPSLHEELVKVFAELPGKGVPTSKQAAEVSKLLPPEPGAHAAFPPWVKSKISRIRHAGVLPSLVPEFLAWWKQQQTTPSPPERMCWICEKPLGDGGEISGAHGECWGAAYEKKGKANV